MPFDALFLTAVRCELEGSLTGCRVDKVQQPQRDTLILSMRGAAGGGKLLLTASPNHPRIHLTNEPAENPAQPPMFCMLLRKHLTGGRLVGMQQPEMERLLDLTFDCTDEMGSPTQKHLILEIMGRNSNLILTAEDGRILDCLRRVDFEMSEQRQVLPGLYYHLPPTQGKRDPFAVTQEELTALLAAQRSPRRLDGWLLDTFGGFSPLVCRELAFCLTGDLDTDVSELPEAEKTALAARLHARIEQLRTQPPQPVLTGIGKFPKNERILDGLMQLYTAEQGVGDPADLIALIDKAIEDNPSNVDLWFGRGRIFYALKDYDQSIESFKKVVELKPDLFEGNYYLGVFYTIKGDALNKEMNEKQYSSQAVYDADLKVVNDVYKEAVPWFEKAHQIKPDDVDTLEFLKSICFRLRDEAGIMEKYNTYNALYKQVKGIE